MHSMKSCWKWLSLLVIVSGIVFSAPPVFAPIGEERALNSVLYFVEGMPVEFTVSVEDPDGDDITLWAEDVPPTWAHFDSTTGTFSGMAPLWSDDYDIRREQPGKFDIKIYASDGTYTVEKIVTVVVIEDDWVPKTMAEMVADRALIEGGAFRTPVAVRHVHIDTIWTPYCAGKNIMRIAFGFTSQVSTLGDSDWVAELNYAYLPLGTPAAYNAAGIIEGAYGRDWGDSALAKRACAELDIPTLIIDRDWEWGHPSDIMTKHNEAAIDERSPEYIFYVYSAAHYLRSIDALVTVIDSFTDWPVSYENFRAIFTGFSKMGHTCLAAAAVDTHRVVGYMSAGSAGIDADASRLLNVLQGGEAFNPESSPNYLGVIMKYYTEPLLIQHQANPNVQALPTQGTNDAKVGTDGYTAKYVIGVSEQGTVIPHRLGVIPNLNHSPESPHHSIFWRMWLAHCFLGRPVSSIDSVHHYVDGDSIVVEAAVSGLPDVFRVVVYATNQCDSDTSAWNLFEPYLMSLDGTVYRTRIPRSSTAYYIEVSDSADGVRGVVTFAPVPVNRDYPLLKIAPGPINHFSGTSDTENIFLHWHNPNDADFAGVIIVCDTVDYPENPLDGEKIYDGVDTNCVHSGIVSSKIYYYSAFSYDTMGNYSSSSTVEVDGGTFIRDMPSAENICLLGISAYPNPFNSSVEISVFGGRGFERQTPVGIEICDLRGNVVYADDVGGQNFEPLQNGTRSFIWRPDQSVPSGIYIAHARLGATHITKRIIYLK